MLRRFAHLATSASLLLASAAHSSSGNNSGTPTPQTSLAAAAPTVPAAAAQAKGQPAVALPPFAQASTWHYRVSTAYFAGSITRAQMQFQPTAGQGYRASLAVSVAGQNLLQMQTTGQRGTADLIPSRFEERVMGTRKEVRQEKGQAFFPKEQLRFPLPAVATDSVSIHYQMQQWLASGTLPTQAGAYRDVWLMRPEGIFHWRYQVRGMQTLDLPGLGRIAALNIVPQPLGKGTAKSELWFAPSLGWAPVRIKMQLLDQTWVEMNWQAEK